MSALNWNDLRLPLAALVGFVSGTLSGVVKDLVRKKRPGDERIAELTAEVAALKQQIADGDLAFDHANEVVGKLEADVTRLSGTEGTMDNAKLDMKEIQRHEAVQAAVSAADCFIMEAADADREELILLTALLCKEFAEKIIFMVKVDAERKRIAEDYKGIMGEKVKLDGQA